MDSQIQNRIKSLVKKHGSLRKAAKATGFSVSYLCVLSNGKHDNPTLEVLKKLGFKLTC